MAVVTAQPVSASQAQPATLSNRQLKKIARKELARDRSPWPRFGLATVCFSIALFIVILIWIIVIVTQNVATPGLHFKVGMNSCNSDRACYGLRKASIIGDSACYGMEACYQDNRMLQVTDRSCWGTRACFGMLPNTFVGSNSCHGDGSCMCCGGLIADNTTKMDCDCAEPWQKRLLAKVVEEEKRRNEQQHQQQQQQEIGAGAAAGTNEL